jgi:hypothetical protein
VSLVKDHVLELLIKDWTRENVCIEGLAVCATVKDIFPGIAKAVTYERFRCSSVRVRRPVLFSKRRRVTLTTFEQSSFSNQEFQQLPDSHPRGETMRIHD